MSVCLYGMYVGDLADGDDGEDGVEGGQGRALRAERGPALHDPQGLRAGQGGQVTRQRNRRRSPHGNS